MFPNLNSLIKITIFTILNNVYQIDVMDVIPIGHIIIDRYFALSHV